MAVPINLILERSGKAMRLSDENDSVSITVGHKTDNNAYELVIARAQEFINQNLILKFDDYSAALGAGDVYRIPEALTQARCRKMNAMIVSPDGTEENSNIVALYFGDALSGGDTPPEPLPDPILDLQARALCDFDDTQVPIPFFNQAGTIVKELHVSGGSGGTNDYQQLVNKPQINGVVLTGNRTLDALGIASKTTLDGHVGNKSNPHDVRRTQIVDFAHTHLKSDISDFAHTHPQSDINGLEDRLLGFRNAIHVLVADSETQQGEIEALESSKATPEQIAVAVDAERNRALIAEGALSTEISRVEAKVENIPVTYPFETFDEMLMAVGNEDGFYQYYPWDVDHEGPTVPLYPSDADFVAELKVNDTFVVADVRVINDYYWDGSHAREFTSIVDLSNYETKSSAGLRAAETLVTANTYTDQVASGLVAKESGKGLSSNDYTTAEKAKLTDIQPFAINEASVNALLTTKGYATTEYVDALVGDINAVLESLAQGGAL